MAMRLVLSLILMGTAHGLKMPANSGASQLQEDISALDLWDDEYKGIEQNYQPMLDSSFLELSPSQKKPHIFIHVHKSLGTWMCLNAKRNSVNVPADMAAGDRMCQRKDDSPWEKKSWSFFERENSCAQRAAEAKAKGYDFMEIERWVDWQKDYCPEDFTYSIVMREPIKRAMSHMTAHNHTWDMVEKFLQTTKTADQANDKDLLLNSYIPYDNFYVRTLAQAYHVPVGELTNKHLEAAKHQLAKLDAVMIADNLMTDVPQVEKLTGWESLKPATAINIHNNKCGTKKLIESNPECKKYQMPHGAEDRFNAMNDLDIELYNFAKTLAQSKTTQLQKGQSPSSFLQSSAHAAAEPGSDKSDITDEDWAKMKLHFSCDQKLGEKTEEKKMKEAFKGMCSNEDHPEFKVLADVRVDPRFEKNHKKIYGKDGWLDEAYVAYFGVNKADTEQQMKWLIKSVHWNSERPVIAVNFGDADVNWTPEEFPRLVLLKARSMRYQQNGDRRFLSFNFNKFRSMMVSKVRTGIMLDADQFVAPAGDRLFKRVAKEQDESYPYVMLPVHWMSKDDDPKFPNHPYAVYDFKCEGCPERTQRWGHAHPTWTHHTLQFLGKWLNKVMLLEQIGDKKLNHLEDEDVLNVALWAEKVTKQWCKFDVPFTGEFFKFLSHDADAMPTYVDPKWYPDGTPLAFYTAHHAVNFDETEAILKQFNKKEEPLAASLIQLNEGVKDRSNKAMAQLHKMLTQGKWTEKNTEIKVPGPIHFRREFFDSFEDLKKKYPDVPCVM